MIDFSNRSVAALQLYVNTLLYYAGRKSRGQRIGKRIFDCGRRASGD
jgi:hypothetical protein